MISISLISKIASRLTGFIYWTTKYLQRNYLERSIPEIALLLKTINETYEKDIIAEIETYRQKMIFQSMDLSSIPKESIPIDLSKQNLINKVSKHARSSASPQLNAVVLRQLVRYNRGQNILELGTSIGISSAYMGLNLNNHIDTIDMDIQLSRVAEYWHRLIGMNNVSYYRGSFDQNLPIVLDMGKQYDLVFIDGDHSYLGTINNYNRIIAHCSPNAIIVIDDIYWSWEMQKAWKEIIQSKHVKIAINLYHMGIIQLGQKSNYLNEIHMAAYNFWDWVMRKHVFEEKTNHEY